MICALLFSELPIRFVPVPERNFGGFVLHRGLLRFRCFSKASAFFRFFYKIRYETACFFKNYTEMPFVVENTHWNNLKIAKFLFGNPRCNKCSPCDVGFLFCFAHMFQNQRRQRRQAQIQRVRLVIVRFR